MIKYIVIGVIAAIIVAVIAIIKSSSKRRKHAKELAMRAQDKLREEALDKIILNPDVANANNQPTPATPFHVSYDPGTVEHAGAGSGKAAKTGGSKLMVQLTENSELSAKKYMLDPSKTINIGSSETENHIVVMDSNVDRIQCNIIESKNKIIMRNAGYSGRLVLARGKERAFVERTPVEIKSGDRIIIGERIFKVDIIKVKV